MSVLMSAFFVTLTFVRVAFWTPSRLPFVLHLLGCALFWQCLRAAAVRRSRRMPAPPR